MKENLLRRVSRILMVAAMGLCLSAAAAETTEEKGNAKMVGGPPDMAILEAGFGKAEIDLKSPRMTALWLRQPDGSLTAKSLLAADLGGCTYLVGWTAPADARGDRRFESSTSRAHRVRLTRGADNTVSKVVLEGILPAEDAPAVEDWEIALSPNGAELVWKVTRTWRRPFQVRVSGTPALFLGPFGGEGGYDPKRPAVTSTLWYEPGRILGKTHPRWPEGMYRRPTAQTLADRDTWAVYKLFIDLVQYPAIVFGVASPEQARKMLATADARLAVLEREHGYTGCATLSALWPIPVLNTERFRAGEEGTYWPFGQYMNGGSLLAETYWEVVARAKTGDAAGAYQRLRRFAEKWGTGGWFGRNGALINGEVGGGNGEVYLADLVVTSASLVNGILGIHPTWDKLEVEPCLPSGWDSATATVIYKGVRHTVAIRNGQATVTPKDRVYDFSSSTPAKDCAYWRRSRRV